ncbi:MarR family transcriptional regulator [Kribbella sancticallisti]|uniref:MarR family transcriptional regulator n=1 Tax=Kribbella sancticallisti TaxID=460087 RepID=A0ABP4QJ60_9ACTN
MQLAHDAPAQDVLEGVSSLVRAVRCVEHRHLWPDAGLKRADAGVLKVLAKGGEQRGGEIAAKLGVDASVVSRQLSTLEADGLVSRRPDPADARVSLVQLSELGRDRLDALYAGYARQLRAALSDWEDDEMIAAADALRRIASAVTQAAESARHPNTSTGD